MRCAAAHLRESCRLGMAGRTGLALADVRCANGVFMAAGRSASYLELAPANGWDQAIDTAHAKSSHAPQDLVGTPPAITPVRHDVAAKVFG